MPSAKIQSVSGDARLALGFVLQNRTQRAAQQFSPIQGVGRGALDNGFVLQNSTNARLSYFDASKAKAVPSVFAVVYGL
jgi:hypothetical protein